jgi:Eco57I restriction-modification methylase
MQQPEVAIELPQFVSIAAVALHLAQAYTSWHAPDTGEDAFDYFNHQPRHTGNEHSLRASLIRERILPVFGYDTDQIEYESRERFDLTLWSRNGQHRRRIAIIETKSSSQRNLTAIQKGRESPVEQLERYLTQGGLYLGVLTNGNEWHLFDFALGTEPLASFSFLELAAMLQDATTEQEAQRRLANQPLLRQALAINFYYLDAQHWEQTDIFRQHIANPAYYRIASLRQTPYIELLVQQIKQVLGSLRDTIQAQFALLQQRYDEYQKRNLLVSETDPRPFADVLHASIENIVQSSSALHFHAGGELLRTAMIALITETVQQFLADGDMDAFSGEYLQKTGELLKDYEISQMSLLETKSTHVTHLRLPAEGLDKLLLLLRIHYNYLQELAGEYALSKNTIEAYQAWKASVHHVFNNPVDEFCLQTAYIHFVRLFFVRVCEDHGLILRRISNGPFARFEEYRDKLLSGIKNTYIRLLEETYQRARTVYHNFFGHHELFDWFSPDEYTILALFDLLNRYDFQGLSADVLGRVYNEGYIEAKERSERGQFYTPPQVVDYMLDSLGIPRRDEADELKARAFLEKSVGDLSCGSGTFLVAAATRKSAILQRLVATREVSPEYAIMVLTDTFLGLDLNPFACYLAEINLLIQCLPFLLDDQGHLCRSIDRFHIYSADSLTPTRTEQMEAYYAEAVTGRFTLLPKSPRGHVLTQDERNIIDIKLARGFPEDLTHLHSGAPGLDYLLGNPPYVSAGESMENLPYRNAIQEYGIYQLLYQRWDLFVPFFERNLHFLRPETGRLGLIVSCGIETEGYAERLRQLLAGQYHLLQIDFFPGLRLFQDAAIENTIVLLEHRTPTEEDTVTRRVHRREDCTLYDELPPALQLASNGQIFRWRYDPLLDKRLSEGSIPLCAIVYVGTGIEAQSKESLDPIVRGQRQKLFTLDDVFLPPSPNQQRPVEYTDDGVLGDDVDRYFLRRKRFVAYENFRPQMRRPRHRILFKTPEKLLLGETSGGYYDRSGLFANHSVQVVVPWSALEQASALEEPGIRGVYRESRQIAKATNGLVEISALFDLRYLLAIINSRFIREFLAANRLEGTREGRIYPDVWKRLPIKLASPAYQQEIAAKVDAIQSHYEQLAALPTLQSLAADPTIGYLYTESYLALGTLRFTGDIQYAIGEKPALHDERLILHRQPLTYLESSEPELLRYLELYLNEINPKLQGRTWAEARTSIRIPSTIIAVKAFMVEIDRLAAEQRRIRSVIESISEEIEALLATTYREPADQRMEEIVQEKL